MKHFEIKNIDLRSLAEMEQLLSLSVGYPISMADEISYFEEESPKGWFYASEKNGRKVGFIRSFKQGEAWSQGDLYVEASNQDRMAIAKELLQAFLAGNSFPANHRVRFDVPSNDGDLIHVFRHLEANVKSQTFHYFELAIPAGLRPENAEESSHKAKPEHIAEAMSNLHPVSSGEAQEWIDSGSLRIEMVGDQVAAVAQIYIHPQSAEINRIATHKEFLRQGHSRSLLTKISAELSAINIPTLFLKVEDVRTPAIEFYKNFGFEEIHEKQQTWYSIYF
ncbi:GNAT family N-acetyltransferase [Bdellovibrio sp. HCB290]|uniref:GNAT family N-acetyltransferase n=1 Tax=Bdellovibrio sp. HCB290 TaxID=3394356 RepID=UPI0039B6089B